MSASRPTQPATRLLRFERLESRRLLAVGVVGTAEQAVELLDFSAALFVENQGQWADDSIRYAFFGNGANVLHTDTGPVFQLFQSAVGGVSDGDLDFVGGDSVADPVGDSVADPLNSAGGFSLRPGGDYPSESWPESETMDGSLLEPLSLSETDWSLSETDWSPSETPPTGVVFSMRFEGAETIEPVGWDRAQTYFNYYVGDQDTWRSGVPAFETVAYPGLYDGIDLLTWGRPDSLKYEFRVAPGADYKQIRVRYEGIESLSLAEDGTLRVETAVGTLFDAAPYIYQELDGQQVEVAGNFTLLDEQTYTFTISGPYDAGAELVIDPELDWSTYLGRSGEEIGLDIAVDGDGNVLATGLTESSGWISGGFDTIYNRGGDAYVVKFSPSGSHLWSTYLGGSSEDVGSGIAVDAAGNVLVTGGTFSPDWAISGGFDTSYNGRGDGFVVKLSPSGDHVWSTYLGGGVGDDLGRGVVTDGDGNVLVTGKTRSPGWVTGGFDITYNGGSSDDFVVKLSSTGKHLWSTYLGGSNSENAAGIAVDAAGNALVAGSTGSPGWVSGGFNTTHGVSMDAYVVKLSSAGDHVWSTYLGGSNMDFARGIAVDAEGNALVSGTTSSSGWVLGGLTRATMVNRTPLWSSSTPVAVTFGQPTSAEVRPIQGPTSPWTPRAAPW